MKKIEKLNELELYSIGNSCSRLELSFSQHRYDDNEGLVEAIERCPTTKWRLPGNKFGLTMRISNNQLETAPPDYRPGEA